MHEFPTLPIVRCCTTLKNTTAYTSLQKLVNKSAMHAGNFIVVTKQEILVMSLTDVFDAASRRNNDVILLPAIRRVSGNDFVPAGVLDSAPAHCAIQPLVSKQPSSQSCGLRDLGCHAASCLPQTNP